MANGNVITAHEDTSNRTTGSIPRRWLNNKLGRYMGGVPAEELLTQLPDVLYLYGKKVEEEARLTVSLRSGASCAPRYPQNQATTKGSYIITHTCSSSVYS